MYKSIEKDFKKVSEYYAYRKMRVIFWFSMGLVIAVCGGLNFASYLPDWLAFVIIPTIEVVLLIIFNIVKPKTKQDKKFNELRLLKIEKRDNYLDDKDELRKIIEKHGISTINKKQEAVNHYRNTRSLIISNGNLFAILALIVAAFSFIDGGTKDGDFYGRAMVMLIIILLPILVNLIIKRTDIYSNFYKVLEELLSEILIEDLDKEPEKSKKQIRKSKKTIEKTN